LLARQATTDVRERTVWYVTEQMEEADAARSQKDKSDDGVAVVGEGKLKGAPFAHDGKPKTRTQSTHDLLECTPYTVHRI